MQRPQTEIPCVIVKRWHPREGVCARIFPSLLRRACVHICAPAFVFLINHQCIHPEQNSQIQLLSVELKETAGDHCMELKAHRALCTYYYATAAGSAMKRLFLSVVRSTELNIIIFAHLRSMAL